MGKQTFEQYGEVMKEINGKYFEGIRSSFRYVDESDVLPISRGGLQKEIEFRMEENRSFGLVAKLGKFTKEKEDPATLEVIVRIREDGHWKDYFDGVLVKEHGQEARLIAEAAKPLIEKLQELLGGTDIVLVDQTNFPLDRWAIIQKDRTELERCKRLYALSFL